MNLLASSKILLIEFYACKPNGTQINFEYTNPRSIRLIFLGMLRIECTTTSHGMRADNKYEALLVYSLPA